MKQSITFDDPGIARELFGDNNKNLNIIAQGTGARIGVRGLTVFLEGDDSQVELAYSLLEQTYGILRAGHKLYANDIQQAVRILSRDRKTNLLNLFLDTVYISSRKRAVHPKNLGQKRYVDAMRNDDLVFCIGPAGTGKTYLAMAMAVAALQKKEIKQIILTRPAVEAGERLGFLPGDLAQKVNPYLRPLYDALNDMMEPERSHQLIERGIIEVAPLAFMRGRTLNEAFVILDEAQNTTTEQMKMFLTRLGFSSKAVVTGDITQVDLPETAGSGLITVQKILKNIEGIGFIHLTENDVVRHPIVQAIITAYDQYERTVIHKRNEQKPDIDKDKSES